uniref:Uncharacterized protein n=1 Tax=Cacopsylla melanoneura TaxID=428564 RepID=A0A8D9BKX1_9HEMI
MLARDFWRFNFVLFPHSCYYIITIIIIIMIHDRLTSAGFDHFRSLSFCFLFSLCLFVVGLSFSLYLRLFLLYLHNTHTSCSILCHVVRYLLFSLSFVYILFP